MLSGHHKELEAYIVEWSSELSGRPELLVELLEAECLNRADFGAVPNEEELRGRFPEIWQKVRLPTHEMLRQRNGEEETSPPAIGKDNPPAASDRFSPVPDEDFLGELEGQSFGRYQVHARLGKGGMGTVAAG